MISVLLFSRKPGQTPWAAVRGSRVVRARGLREGDIVKIEFRGNGHEGACYMFRAKDGEAGLPDGVTHVRAEHVKCAEGSRVCVDLE